MVSTSLRILKAIHALTVQTLHMKIDPFGILFSHEIEKNWKKNQNTKKHTL